MTAMENERVSLDDFYNAFVSTLGVEGTWNVIKEGIKSAGLEEEKEYSPEDALKICEMLKTKGGFVRIVANLFSMQLRLKRMDS